MQKHLLTEKIDELAVLNEKLKELTKDQKKLAGEVKAEMIAQGHYKLETKNSTALLTTQQRETLDPEKVFEATSKEVFFTLVNVKIGEVKKQLGETVSKSFVSNTVEVPTLTVKRK